MRFEVFTFRSPEGLHLTSSKITHARARYDHPGWVAIPETKEVHEFPSYREMWEEHHGAGSWPAELQRREAEEAKRRKRAPRNTIRS